MSDASESSEPVKTAVVTGHHPADMRGLTRLFRGLDGVDAYIQHMEDFSADVGGVRDWYDAVVFYNMHGGSPADDGPWYASRTREAMERLGRTEQGVVLLHHGILAFLEWDFWSKLAGIPDRTFTSYAHDQKLRIHVENADHPITAGLSDWEMIDETYEMASAGEGNEILLTTDHPECMRTIAWTRTFDKARVFCLQSGHDDQTFVDPNFREVLRRGILWSAGRL